MKDVQAQLSRDVKSGQSVRQQPLPLGQGETGALTERTLSLLPIPPHVHHPGKGGVANLLLQKDGTVVEMGQCSVIIVKDMAIFLRTVPLMTSIR